MDALEPNDAALVAQSLEGSRDAFRRIVERYQTLISSLAYSATGNISHSEDVAQETFLAAWTNLRSLREPEKLRPWLCGIARNRIQRHWRATEHEPAGNASSLEEAGDWPADEAMPSEEAISKEEEAILWRSLARIPESYREPLVLFYRQGQSVQSVAAALELSEDAVRQRLSRGRKLLQEEVQEFVEQTLRRTAPTPAFAAQVAAMLPLAAGPVAAAGVGAKGTAAAKSGFLAAWVIPFLGIAAGIVAQWFIVRAATPDRKLRLRIMTLITLSTVLIIAVAIVGPNILYALRDKYDWNERTLFVAITAFWWALCIGMTTWSALGFGRISANLRRSEQAGGGSGFGLSAMSPAALAVAVGGLHLMLFFTLIRWAWRADDVATAVILAVLTVLLSAVAFLRIRTRTGAELARAINAHLGLCSAVLLVAFDLRVDVWLAAWYGTSIAGIHQRFPVWIIPVLTLALVIWGVALPLVRRSRRA